MKSSLTDFLNERRPDSDTIQQVLRYYLAEITDDLSPTDMRNALVEATGDQATVDEYVLAIERDPEMLQDASLMVLSSVWDRAEEADRIKSIIQDAKTKLPIIETAIIAIAGMYGMYLIATGGLKKATKVTKRRKDGSFETTEETEWENVSAPLRAVVDLFRVKK